MFNPTLIPTLINNTMAEKCTSKNVMPRPSVNNVIRHMFKHCDYDCNMFCLSCNQVMKANSCSVSALESHFNTCRPTCYAPAEKTVFYCGPCDVKVAGANRWQYHHLGTKDHKNWCSTRRLYSETCCFCHVVFYDTKENIEKHNRDHVRRSRQRSTAALQNISERILPIMMMKFMAYVYSVHLAYRPKDFTGTIYYCGGCAKWTEGRPVHSLDPNRLDECHEGKSKFHCTYCKTSFICEESEYIRHLESVEHGTLFEKVRQRAYNDDYEGWKVPRIMRRHTADLLVAKNMAPATTICKSCGDIVSSLSILNHFAKCTRLSNVESQLFSDKSATNYYNGFRCSVCSLWLAAVKEWKLHVISESHQTKCDKMFKYIYYECTMCFHLYYGTDSSEEKSFCKHVLSPLQHLTHLMRYVFSEMNKIDNIDVPNNLTFYYWQNTGNFGRCDPSGESAAQSVPHYCQTCRLEFYSDSIAFRQHNVTAEHLLLQQFTPIKTNLYGQHRQNDKVININKSKNKRRDGVVKNVKHVNDSIIKKTGKMMIKDEDAHTRKHFTSLKAVQGPSMSSIFLNQLKSKTKQSEKNLTRHLRLLSVPNPITTPCPPTPPSPISPLSPPTPPSPITPPSPPTQPSPITPPSPPTPPSPISLPSPPSPY